MSPPTVLYPLRKVAKFAWPLGKIDGSVTNAFGEQQDSHTF